MKYLDKDGLTHLWSKIKAKIPTKTSQLTNDSGYSTFSGSYNDLTNKPTIPTVNNGTLTIQKNGTNVQTFTANQSGNATANITVPTKTSELTNNSGFLTSSSNLDTNKLVEPYFKNATTKTTRPLFDITRANRLAFLPADQIIIEKSVDAGATWTSYGATDAQKIALFNGRNNGAIYLPKIDDKKNTNCMIRITITAMKYNVPSGTSETEKYSYWNSNNINSTERYCSLDTMYFWLNANSDRIGLIVQRAPGNNANNWSTIFDTTNQGSNVGLSGWSGMDMITFSYGVFGGGTNQVGQYWNYRLIFRTATTNSSHLYDNDYLSTSGPTSTQSVVGIRAYGDNVWTSSNELMKADHLYTWDDNKRMNVPNGIRPNTNNAHTLGTSDYKWNNVYSTTFTGALSGNATSATTATKATGDKNGDDITTTYYKASNPNGYTSNTGTITSVKMNGSTISSSGEANLGTVLTSHQSIKTINNNTITGTGNVSVGTITGITMNGSSKGTSGVVDLGTVITAHQDISGKQDKITSTNKLDYSLLSNTPTIPTVNNATLTIQKNGATVKTFTANASSNVTANITVPTKTSDITNDSNFVTSSDLSTAIGNVWKTIYPVGSIYITTNNTNPQAIFGGRWTEFGIGKTLVGVDTNDTDFNTVEKTGGEKEHTLTIDEMPSHTHAQFIMGGGSTYGSAVNWSTSNVARYYGDATSSEMIGNSGGGDPHNIMQPYITVYMWKRIA